MARKSATDASHTIGRRRKCGVHMLHSPHWAMADTESGITSQGQEAQINGQDRECAIPPWFSTIASQMELDRHIRELESDITTFVDTVIERTYRRKEELLMQVKEIHRTKSRQLAEIMSFQEISELVAPNDTNKQLGNISEHNQGAGKQFNSTNTPSYQASVGGCLRFAIDKEVLDILGRFGAIDEGRSTASQSYVVGAGVKYGFAGEPTKFHVITCNAAGVKSWVPQDLVQAELEDNQGRGAFIEVINKCNGRYDVTHTVPMAGKYDMKVTVNGQLLPDFPIQCVIFPEHQGQFESPSDLNIESMHERWTLQHNDQTALLEHQDEQHYSKIYARLDSLWYSQLSWRIRLTVACSMVTAKLGCASRSIANRIFDEEYSFNFNIADYTDRTELTRDAVSEEQHQTHRSQNENRSGWHAKRHHKIDYHRKQSTYKRSTWTFLIIVDRDAKTMHAIQYETGDEKITAIGGTTHVLQPYFGLRHFCKNETCPRPALSLA